MFKQFQKRSFLIIFCIMATLGATLCAGAYYWQQWLFSSFPNDQGQTFLTEKIPYFVGLLGQDRFYQVVLPGVLIIFLVTGVIIWGLHSALVSGLFKTQEQVPESPKKGESSKKDFLDQKIEQERKRRLFLHTLSVLQREGRLLDFFDEDLSAYEDDQIGAAVRSIQEDCKKAVKKYIDPKPVVKGEEGDEITIEEGFDIAAINLVGNVSGHPPFNGKIKHPGWRAGKKDVPKLSDIQDPGIMTPAEIEVQ